MQHRPGMERNGMLNPYNDSIRDLVFLYAHTGKAAGGKKAVYSIAAAVVTPDGQRDAYASHVQYPAFSERDRYYSNLSKDILAAAPAVGAVQRELADFLKGRKLAFAFSDHSDPATLQRFCGLTHIIDLNLAAEYFLQHLPAHSFKQLWEFLFQKKRGRISFAAAEIVALSVELVRYICGVELNDGKYPRAAVIRHFLKKSDTLFGRVFVHAAAHYRGYFGGLFDPCTAPDTDLWQAFVEKETPMPAPLEKRQPRRKISETEITDRFEQLARSEKGFRLRPSQIAYAHHVTRALNERTVLCLEAGTGTGKTQGYLIPVMEFLYRNPGARVAVATYTKNLQSQIFNREIELIRKKFSIYKDVPVVLLKGKSSYLCAEKLAMLYDETLAGRRLLAWLYLINNLYHYQTADIDGIGEHVWRHLNPKRYLAHALNTASAEEGCDGSHTACPAQAVAAAARAARLIVTNHHKLALLDQEKTIYRLFTYYVIDEANHFEKAVRDAFRIEADALSVSTALASLEESVHRIRHNALQGDAVDEKGIFEQTENLRQAVKSLWRRLLTVNRRSNDSEESLLFTDAEKSLRTDLQTLFSAVRQPVADLSHRIDDLLSEASMQALMLPRRTARKIRAEINLLQKFTLALDRIEENFDTEKSVLTYRLLGKHFLIHAAPVAVADIVKDTICADRDSVVYTAATLCERRRFDRFREIVGLDQPLFYPDSDSRAPGEPRPVLEERIASPFAPDAEEITIPQGAVNGRYANKKNWLESVVRLIPELVKANRGRTLVLFASYQDLQHVARETADDITNAGYPVLIQQPGIPSINLCDAFRTVKESVLFGVDTFWYGVDFPGDTLTQVIITRLPYPSARDPFQMTRKRIMPADVYWKHYRYQKDIKLKQGIGRLIRSETDTGRVIVLDTRFKA